MNNCSGKYGVSHAGNIEIRYDERSQKGEVRTDLYSARTSDTATSVEAPMLSNIRPMPPISQDDQERLWSRIDKSGGEDACWPWSSAFITGGYGGFSIKNQRRGAHRCVLVLSTGEDRPDMCACHSCDNPPCCNPRHLFWGSWQDNVSDMLSKGRGNPASGEKHWTHQKPHLVAKGETHYSKRGEAAYRYGEGHQNCVHSDEFVRMVCAEFEAGTPATDLAEKYSIRASLIRDWWRGTKRWKATGKKRAQ